MPSPAECHEYMRYHVPNLCRFTVREAEPAEAQALQAEDLEAEVCCCCPRLRAIGAIETCWRVKKHRAFCFASPHGARLSGTEISSPLILILTWSQCLSDDGGWESVNAMASGIEKSGTEV